MNKDTLLVARIGLICTQWSAIEYLLSTVIWQLLNLDDDDAGKIVTGGLDMQPKVNMAIALARHMKAPKYLTAALVETRKRIQSGLDVQRNRAVHGMQFTMPDGQELIETHRGKGARIKTPLDIKEFEELSSQLTSIRETVLWPPLERFWKERHPARSIAE